MKTKSNTPGDPDHLAEMTARKDAAYLERNKCVALIARMAMAAGFRACVAKTAIEGWSEDWHGCVYVELPTGQASWHFHDSQAHLFAGIPEGNAVWDGHTTEEKYRRVSAAFQPPATCTPWIDAATKPTGWERRMLLWVVWPDSGWPTRPEPRIGWWKHGPGCFAVDDIENANHLVTHWMDVAAPAPTTPKEKS